MVKNDFFSYITRRLNRPFLIEGGIATNYVICSVVIGGIYKVFNEMGQSDIVAIDEANGIDRLIFFNCGERQVPCGRDAAVFLVYENEAMIILDEFFEYFFGIVSGSIIDQKNGKVAIALILNGQQAFTKVFFRVVYRHNNSYFYGAFQRGHSCVKFLGVHCALCSQGVIQRMAD